MKKIVLLFFIFFAITARVDFAKASTIANPAYTFIVSKSFDQVAWTTKMSYTEASSAQMSAIAEQEPIMKLWIQAENSPSVDVSTMYNELVVNRATEAVNLIGTEFPSVDKDALRDFFILNIGTSYGFKQ